MKTLRVVLRFTLVAMVLCGSCGKDDGESKTSDFKWDQAYVLSAVPMKAVVGTDGEKSWVPVCRADDGEPDGLLFNTLFVGFNMADESEQDRSIKAFDKVEGHEVHPSEVTPELFGLTIDCLEARPDTDLLSCVMETLWGGGALVEDVAFYSYNHHNPTNKDPVAVAVLLDMSGSMNGLVNPAPPYNEDPLDVIGGLISGSLQELATDSMGVRYGAFEDFVETLNEEDPVILFAYWENRIDVVCEVPGEPGADVGTKVERCFSSNRELIFGFDAATGAVKSPLDSLRGEERGRTPLWSAVDMVYSYMQAPEIADRLPALKHILVIGDGPDTCGPTSDTSLCTGQCMAYNTSFETVRERIESEPLEDRIPIHFVQMQARGYPRQDPRQQEIACLTGGQYAWVNTLDIPANRLAEVLSLTLKRIRYTFRGYWRLAVPLALTPQAGELTAGSLYSVAGTGKVLPGAHQTLVKAEETFDFSTLDTSRYGLDGLDRRVTFRVPCDPADPEACPTVESATECSAVTSWCDEQERICKSAVAWVDDGDVAGCDVQDVYVSLEVRTESGGSTQVAQELFKLANVATRCCMGQCMPPAPPPVPEEVAKPGGMASACFWYNDMKGWMLGNPGVGEFDEQVWFYSATLNMQEGCELKDFEPYLTEYAEPADADDWAYCAEAANCFPPPK